MHMHCEFQNQSPLRVLLTDGMLLNVEVVKEEKFFFLPSVCLTSPARALIVTQRGDRVRGDRRTVTHTFTHMAYSVVSERWLEHRLV